MHSQCDSRPQPQFRVLCQEGYFTFLQSSALKFLKCGTSICFELAELESRLGLLYPQARDQFLNVWRTIILCSWFNFFVFSPLNKTNIFSGKITFGLRLNCCVRHLKASRAAIRREVKRVTCIRLELFCKKCSLDKGHSFCSKIHCVWSEWKVTSRLQLYLYTTLIRYFIA